MVKSSDIIFQCFVNLTDGLKKYQDNWMSDETWFGVISSRHPDIINSIGFSCTTFICAISMHASQCGTQNALGIFIHQFKTSCPYDSGQRRRVSYFYRQVAGKPPSAPSGPHHCKDKHVEAMPISLSTAEEREMTQSLRIVPQSIMPQSAKNGIKGNLNDGNENNASGSGGGGGEEEGGGSEEEGGQTGDVALIVTPK